MGQTMCNVIDTPILNVKYVYIFRQYDKTVDRLFTTYPQGKISNVKYKISVHDNKIDAFAKIPMDVDTTFDEFVFENSVPIDANTSHYDDHIAVKCRVGSDFSLGCWSGIYDIGNIIDGCPTHMLVHVMRINSEVKIYNIRFFGSFKSTLNKIHELVGKDFEKIFSMPVDFTKENSTIENDGSTIKLFTNDGQNSIEFKIIELECDREYLSF